MIPLLGGFMILGLLGAWLSDHFSVRGLSGCGMLVLTGGILLLMLLAAKSSQTPFARRALHHWLGFGVFARRRTRRP